MIKREELLKEQHQLNVLFSAWMEDKKKHEVVTYQKDNGDIVKHYPNGEEKVIVYAE